MNLIKTAKAVATSSVLASCRCGVRGLILLAVSIVFIFTFIRSECAFSQDASMYPSFSFDLNYGLTTSKSKAVTSNDTGTALSYSLGGFAGSDKNIEWNLGFETDTTPYLLNSSKIVYDWQDTKLRYHLGYFYAGLVFSRLNWTVNAAGVDIVDAAGSGYGASAGYFTPVGKGGMLRIDVTTVNIVAMKNALSTEVAVPSRLDIDIGAAVDIWGKWLDFTFGYKMRTMTVKTNSSYAESHSSTYVGLRMTTSR